MTYYYNLSSKTINDNCSLCLDPMKNMDIVAHQGLGDRHPMHRECAKVAAANHRNLCLTCRTPINPESLLTWKDKGISELNSMRNDSVEAAVHGISNAKLVAIITAIAVGVLFSTMMTLKIASPSPKTLIVATATIGAMSAMAIAGTVVIFVISQVTCGFLHRRIERFL